jgi:hypothetical protein
MIEEVGAEEVGPELVGERWGQRRIGGHGW